jgi:hypothetical protein
VGKKGLRRGGVKREGFLGQDAGINLEVLK